MDFLFLVMEKSWKINVEKRGAPCNRLKSDTGMWNTTSTVIGINVVRYRGIFYGICRTWSLEKVAGCTKIQNYVITLLIL